MRKALLTVTSSVPSKVSFHIGGLHEERGEIVVFVASFKHRLYPTLGAGRSREQADRALILRYSHLSWGGRLSGHDSCLSQAGSQTREDPELLPGQEPPGQPQLSPAVHPLPTSPEYRGDM